MNGHQHRKSIIDEGNLSTARLETLTDGIFAIAMTILVLDIKVPELLAGATSRSLLLSLKDIWPNIVSFAVSFVILGMFWVAHHTQFRFIKKLDNKLIWLNMFYLLFVSLLPFTAALLGRFHNNQTAVIIYGLQLMVMVLLHYFMFLHSRKFRILDEDMHNRLVHLVNRVTAVAVIAYSVGIICSFWNVNITLIIYALTPLPYIFGWVYGLA